MVTRGTWHQVRDRSEWIGRRDAARAHLKAARNALAMAEDGDDGRLIVQGAILAAIGYGDALTIRAAGIKNGENHQQLPVTVRHALGNQAPRTELTRLTRLLSQKDDWRTDTGRSRSTTLGLRSRRRTRSPPGRSRN